MQTGEFEFQGVTLDCDWSDDPDCGPPWENSDGHGPVRRVTNGWGHLDKRAGERVLNPDARRGNYVWLYDWQAALKIARRDGWGAPDERKETPGQRAARAVAQDFEFLAGWLRGTWQYIGVTVTHPASGAQASLWGVESNAGEYLTEVRNELAGEVLASEAFKLSQARPNCIAVLRALADESDAWRGMTTAEREAILTAIKLLTR